MAENPIISIKDEGFATDQLNAFVERIERLEEEKAALAADIREVYAEAKGNRFDTKVLRKVVALHRMDMAKRIEHQAILNLYMHRLGMLADTPLGVASVKRAFPASPPN